MRFQLFKGLLFNFVVFLNNSSKMILSTDYSYKLYESPAVCISEITASGILCTSITEDIEILEEDIPW